MAASLAVGERGAHMDTTAEMTDHELPLAMAAMWGELSICPVFGGNVVSSKALEVTEVPGHEATVNTRTDELLYVQARTTHHWTAGWIHCWRYNRNA